MKQSSSTKSLSTTPEMLKLFPRSHRLRSPPTPTPTPTPTFFAEKKTFVQKNFLPAFPHSDLSGRFVQTFQTKEKKVKHFFGAKMKFFSVASFCVFSFFPTMGMFFSVTVKEISSPSDQQVSQNGKLKFARIFC